MLIGMALDADEKALHLRIGRILLLTLWTRSLSWVDYAQFGYLGKVHAGCEDRNGQHIPRTLCYLLASQVPLPRAVSRLRSQLCALW